MRSSVTQEELVVEPLLLRIESVTLIISEYPFSVRCD